MEKSIDEYTKMFDHLIPMPYKFKGGITGKKLPCICDDTGYVELSYAPGKKIPCGFCNKHKEPK